MARRATSCLWSFLFPCLCRGPLREDPRCVCVCVAIFVDCTLEGEGRRRCVRASFGRQNTPMWARALFHRIRFELWRGRARGAAARLPNAFRRVALGGGLGPKFGPNCTMLANNLPMLAAHWPVLATQIRHTANFHQTWDDIEQGQCWPAWANIGKVGKAMLEMGQQVADFGQVGPSMAMFSNVANTGRCAHNELYLPPPLGPFFSDCSVCLGSWRTTYAAASVRGCMSTHIPGVIRGAFFAWWSGPRHLQAPRKGRF